MFGFGLVEWFMLERIGNDKENIWNRNLLKNYKNSHMTKVLTSSKRKKRKKEPSTLEKIPLVKLLLHKLAATRHDSFL